VGLVADGFVQGVHLDRTEENAAEIDALASLLGQPPGLASLLADLNRQARRSRGFFGRAVHRAWTWDREDRRTHQWWPQGVTTSADAGASTGLGNRRVVVVTWYAKEVAGVSQGSRLTFLDLDTLRYRHVLLVVPALRDGRLELRPLRVHAGGVVWCGPYLHIAATSRGFVTCRVDDLMHIPDGVPAEEVESFGYRYVLPVRFAYRAHADDGYPGLRYSFLSLDRSPSPALIAGEYARPGQTTRLARFPLDLDSALLETGEDGFSRPVGLDESGVVQTQGAVVVAGRWYLSVSHGPWWPGSVYVGTPGRARRRRWVAPMGPEDISYSAPDDLLWSVSEHPRRRWLYCMRRSWFR
jgi:hypothetical protein